MNMKLMVIYSFVFFQFFLFASEANEVIKDPLNDFLNYHRVPAGKAIMILESDINSDGKKEVFISFEGRTNAKAGNTWTVYLPMEAGFIRCKKPISFRTDALFIGKYEKFDYPALITYLSVGGGTGSLIAFSIRNNAIEELFLDIDPDISEEGRKIYDNLFEDNVPPEIKKIPYSEVASTIESIIKKEKEAKSAKSIKVIIPPAKNVAEVSSRKWVILSITIMSLL